MAVRASASRSRSCALLLVSVFISVFIFCQFKKIFYCFKQYMQNSTFQTGTGASKFSKGLFQFLIGVYRRFVIVLHSVFSLDYLSSLILVLVVKSKPVIYQFLSRSHDNFNICAG